LTDIPRAAQIALAVLCILPVLVGLVAFTGAEHFAAQNRRKRERGERHGATSTVLLRIVGALCVVLFLPLAVLILQDL
jgi:ABC-type Fe3+ transport system permease subunit